MKKTAWRLLAVLLSASLALIPGCSGSGPVEVKKEGFPLVDKKITLSAMVMSISLHGNFNDMDFTKVMEEKTNVHIDWKVVPNGNEITEAKTLAFASGNMPDMFFITDTHMTNYDVATYGLQGLIAELNELIDGYAPNLSAIFAEHPEYKTMISDTNGRIYSLPAISNETKNHSNYKNKMYINRKWLDTLGLSMPQTTDELYAVLEKFRDGDPNGNGLGDEIPFSTPGLDPAMFGPWGLSFWWDMDIMTIDDNKQVQYVPITDAFKSGLEYWAKMMKEGLLDPESLSQTADQLKAKLSTSDEKIGVFMSNADFMDYGYDRAANYEMVPPLKGPDGKQAWTYMSRENFMGNWAVISGTCKYKEAAMRWIDYLYSEEGTMLGQDGPDGKAYTYQADGKIKDTFNENVPKDDKGNPMEGNAWRYQMTPGYVLPYYRSQSLYEKKIPLADSEKSPAQIKNDELNEKAFALYDPVKPRYSMPYIMFSRQDAGQIGNNGTLAGPIHALASETYQAIIYGDFSIDAEWDAYVQNLKTMGVERLIDIYQGYVDKYYAE